MDGEWNNKNFISKWDLRPNKESKIITMSFNQYKNFGKLQWFPKNKISISQILAI